MKNILFIHPNFPAQFRHIARVLAQKGHRVVFVTANDRKDWQIPGVQRMLYKSPGEKEEPGIFGGLRRAEGHAEAALRACAELRRHGFVPEVVYGASGWGCTWFLRDVFPEARLAGYFEWYYDPAGDNARFGGHEPSLGSRAELRLRNTVMVNDLLTCDLCITPSQWQKRQFPENLRERLVVLHDGIETGYFRPSDEPLDIPGLDLPSGTPIVTYATRGMEPYRGFPQFIEALGVILEKNAEAHAVIAGTDRVCYGSPRGDGQTWKEYMLSRVALPMNRVHFVGSLPYGQYRHLLCHSSVHVYLTRPFVLSWSMLESMSCGCLVVASDTGPVREVIRDGENGLLCDFFSPGTIAHTVLSALERQHELRPLREAARKTIVERYELGDVLPRLEQLLLGEEKER
ncbi:MAG: glycosyltransferase [Deltaproteobacteria bacterium]|nr:glycosyltransferase [Deltaproteobacteria bacterium]